MKIAYINKLTKLVVIVPRLLQWLMALGIQSLIGYKKSMLVVIRVVMELGKNRNRSEVVNLNEKYLTLGSKEAVK